MIYLYQTWICLVATLDYQSVHVHDIIVMPRLAQIKTAADRAFSLLCTANFLPIKVSAVLSLHFHWKDAITNQSASMVISLLGFELLIN